jgi:alpha-methylacyl-CoA racemase
MRVELADLFRSQPLATWLEHLADADVCLTPVLEPGELFDDPQLAARASFATVPDASGNPVGHVRALPTMSGAPADSRRPPSAPGADARAILADLGFTAATIRRLLAGGGIGPAP